MHFIKNFYSRQNYFFTFLPQFLIKYLKTILVQKLQSTKFLKKERVKKVIEKPTIYLGFWSFQNFLYFRILWVKKRKKKEVKIIWKHKKKKKYL